MPTILSHKESKHPQEASEIRSQKCQRQETLDAVPLGCKQPTPVAAASVGKQSDTTLFMERADNLPVQSAQQSLRPQCSSSKTDAVTQTTKTHQMQQDSGKQKSHHIM